MKDDTTTRSEKTRGSPKVRCLRVETAMSSVARAQDSMAADSGCPVTTSEPPKTVSGIRQRGPNEAKDGALPLGRLSMTKKNTTVAMSATK